MSWENFVTLFDLNVMYAVLSAFYNVKYLLYRGLFKLNFHYEVAYLQIGEIGFLFLLRDFEQNLVHL